MVLIILLLANIAQSLSSGYVLYIWRPESTLGIWGLMQIGDKICNRFVGMYALLIHIDNGLNIKCKYKFINKNIDKQISYSHEQVSA